MDILYLIQEPLKVYDNGDLPDLLMMFEKTTNLNDADIVHLKGQMNDYPLLLSKMILISKTPLTIPSKEQLQDRGYYVYLDNWNMMKIKSYQRSMAHDFLETGYSFYIDTMAMQSRLSFPVFNRFFRKIDHNVSQIVELGSNQGGLSVYFHDYTKRYPQTTFTTYDIFETPINLKRWKVDYRKKDIFKPETIREIGEILQRPGVSLLFCDNGNKILEYQTFAKYLKPGDFIMCHDYARNLDEFANEIYGHYWNWCEVTESDLLTTSQEQGLIDYNRDEFKRCAISCKVKLPKGRIRVGRAEVKGSVVSEVMIPALPDLSLYKINAHNESIKVSRELTKNESYVPTHRSDKIIPKSQITFVTAMFDLGRGTLNNNFKRSFDHYLECFSKLLSMDYPMVVYATSDLTKWIQKKRNGRRTKIIEITLDYFRDLEYYSDIQRIRKDRDWVKTNGWLADSPQATMELYNPFNSCKLPWLSEQSRSNPFQTEYLFWVDGGIANTVSMNYLDKIQKASEYLDKFLFLTYPYIPSSEVHGFRKKEFAEWCKVPLTTRVCRAGFFGGNCQEIAQIETLFITLLKDTLRQGLMGTCDESIYTIMSYLEPNLFNLAEIESNGLIYRFFEKITNHF